MEVEKTCYKALVRNIYISRYIYRKRKTEIVLNCPKCQNRAVARMHSLWERKKLKDIMCKYHMKETHLSSLNIEVEKIPVITPGIT